MAGLRGILPSYVNDETDALLERSITAADGDDLSVGHVNVLGEGDDAEDGVDVQDGDAVLAVDDEADDFDALHDSGEVIEPLLKRCGASISARRELATSIRMKGKSRGVVVANRLDVLLDYLYHLFAHDVSESSTLQRS